MSNAYGVRFHEGLTPFLRPISEVKQHPNNPNNGDVEAIVESILTNGFYTVCFAQTSTGNLIAGNHRYAALLALECDTIPVVYLNVDDDQAEALMVGDNEIASLAVRDEDAVLRIVQRLQAGGTPIRSAGFTDESLRDLTRRVQARSHTPIPEDISTTVKHFRRMRVIVDGYLNEDGLYEPFDEGDMKDTMLRLKDLGYRAVGTELTQ